jgi:CMP-N-acetylneuraminic acid synthetase
MGTATRTCLCIIAARKGSKRLSGKNRLPLNGKPLYRYTLEAAEASGIFSSVVFSTDDEAILADLGQHPGIVLDHRPAHLAGDRVVIWDVGLYVLSQYADRLAGVDSLCFLTPCNPFRGARHLTAAFNRFVAKEADGLMSITAFPAPIELPIEINGDWLVRHWTGAHRGAEYPPKYYPNGAIIIIDVDYFRAHRDFYPPKTVGFELGWPYCLDIDDAQDMEMARLIAPYVLSRTDGQP